MGRRFFADRTLGKLCRKLRLLGIDTRYERFYSPAEVLEIVEQERLVLLTRHRQLHSKALRREVESFLLKSNDWRGQLKAVVMRFDIRSTDIRPFTRCADCNALLARRSPDEVILLVPQYVLFTHDHFLQCPACGKVYWKGTHPDRILQTFSGIIPLNGD